MKKVLLTLTLLIGTMSFAKIDTIEKASDFMIQPITLSCGEVGIIVYEPGDTLADVLWQINEMEDAFCPNY